MDCAVLAGMTDGKYSVKACRAAVEAAEEWIRNYCNLPEVPPGLSRTALDIAAELLRAADEAGSDSGAGIETVVIGDTKVGFAERTAFDAQTLIAKYAFSLNRYRRIVF